jgi:hypothetical protein
MSDVRTIINMRTPKGGYPMRRAWIIVLALLFTVTTVTAAGAVQVQVGAFSKESNATDRADRLREIGWDVQIKSNAAGLNRVRVVNLSDSRVRSVMRELDRRGMDYVVIGKEPAPEEQFKNEKEGQSLPESLPPMRFGHEVRLSQTIRNRLDRAMGTEYVWGGESFEEGGFDCSGLLVWLFRFDDMPRVSESQWRWTKRVKKSELRPGDFVFFNFETTDQPDHVGLYLGDDRFVHASSTYGVIKANFEKTYYQKNFYGAGRPPTRR